MQKYLKYALFSLSIISISTGCTSINAPAISLAHEATLSGNYRVAAIESDKEKDLESELDESNQLQTLYAGNSYLYANDYKNSLKRLDEAERIIKYHDEKILLGSTGDLIAQLLLNDTVVDYHATMTDAIIVNTYKAIDYMALGKMDEARVELNRAIDRQRRAKETYSALINKQNEAISQKETDEKAKIASNRTSDKRKKSTLSLDISKTIGNSEIDKMLANKYPTLNQFEKYPEFINPFTNYLAGIFFATQKDYIKSADILKEVHGMTPNSKAVKADLVMVENILDGKKKRINNVWIIYSNGLAPKKEEFRVDVPLFLFTNKVLYTGIALPKMVTQNLATKNLTVFNKDKLISTTQSFASMDRVILTEFQYGYRDVVTRTLFSTLIKTYLQYQLQEELGQYAGLALGLFQALTTRADTRTWENLPKEYQISRITMPKDKRLELKVGTQSINIDLGLAQNAIVFVRMPSALSQVSYTLIRL